jgi:tetratricopeptide (TPR) repeat protein
MATEPALVQPEYAWLYCRADQQHDVDGPQSLALYAATFTHQEPARAYFAEQEWNFDDVELMYLRRAAEKAPGQFPPVLGPDYPPRGEAVLLAKAQAQEDAGQREEALKTIEILVKLCPHNTAAMDRAAMLHYRAGRLEPAYLLLEQWHLAQPDEPLPLVRQALLIHQQGDDASCYDKLRQAMSVSQCRRRANISFLGARIALESYLLPKPEQSADANVISIVKELLGDCLTHDAGHPHALWCLAAVRWLNGDTDALAEQAQHMRDANVADARYHYLSALCHLLGGQFEAVVAACERIAMQVGKNGSMGQRTLAIEAGYLAGLAQIGLGKPRQAIEALKPITFDPKSPTLSYAQALLGEVLFQERRHDEAINAWQALDAQKRHAWKLVDPLAQTTFISALESLDRGEYDQAAEKLRQAGRLGYRDRRLGPLLLLALFKAGQKAIYAGETAPVPVTRSAPVEVL